MHLRAIFATPKWLSEHAHMKIHEMVVLYIDKDEIVWPAGEPPTYSTFKDISKRYSFWMRPGHGRVGGARYSCHCPACCLAFETGEGMDNLLDIANCERRHLNRYETRRGCYRHGYRGGNDCLYPGHWSSQRQVTGKRSLAGAQAVTEGGKICGSASARALVDKGATAHAPRPLLGMRARRRWQSTG